jgi:hypothetical protein
MDDGPGCMSGPLCFWRSRGELQPGVGSGLRPTSWRGALLKKATTKAARHRNRRGENMPLIRVDPRDRSTLVR